MKGREFLKRRDARHDLKQWSDHRAHAEKTFNSNVKSDHAFLVSIGFHKGLAYEKGQAVRETLHPLIHNSLDHCWNAVNETVLGKRSFHKYAGSKAGLGRGLFCIETRSKDGQRYVGPHIHGVFFANGTRQIQPQKTKTDAEQKLTRMFRKIWSNVNVDVCHLPAESDRKKAVNYATKEPGAYATTSFREGLF
ncbi:hypothetical protein [Hyphobacterium sp.]|uniref:hypothetical protein n=1 Tax=Hyphobacterium sp. TaxID=2004662 RepID=UPI003BAB0C39